MYRFYSLLVVPFLSVILIACSSESKELSIPEGVLGREKMVEALVNVHIIEAKGNLGLPHQIVEGRTEKQQLFDSLGIVETAFDSSMAFYSAHPKEMVKMYEQVLEEISRKQAELSGTKEEE